MGSSPKRLTTGTRRSRFWSFRESRPVRESNRRAVVRFAVPTHYISALSVADQVRELQAALSLNKSELARILRVSRPTVYDWLDDGQPNDDNLSRIWTLLRLLRESRVSPVNPLFPRFVRSPLEAGERPLLEALGEETIDEANLRSAIRRAKALGDAIDSRREEREDSPARRRF